MPMEAPSDPVDRQLFLDVFNFQPYYARALGELVHGSVLVWYEKQELGMKSSSPKIFRKVATLRKPRSGARSDSELRPVTPEIETEMPSLILRLLREEDAEELFFAQRSKSRPFATVDALA